MTPAGQRALDERPMAARRRCDDGSHSLRRASLLDIATATAERKRVTPPQHGAKARPDNSGDTGAIERPIPSGIQRRRTSAATSSPRRCARSTSPTSRSIPGASYRGLHDSLVNYLGNAAPQMLLCLHEEHAVAIAHGYAKVTGRAMAAAVHSNVGLMHATMAIFNAWCDRMPVLRARRHRPGRRRQAPAVDRLDPHRARPGRARARLHQVGRPAGLAGGGARGAAARASGSPTRRRRARSTSISTPSMQEAPLAEPLPPLDVAPLHAAGRRRGAARRGRAQAADMLQVGQAPGHPGRPRVARRRRVEGAHRSSPRRSARASSPTSRSAPPSRPTIRCMSTRPPPSPTDELTPLSPRPT